MAAEDQNVNITWEVGSECVVFLMKDKSWCRAIISEINADAYKVTYLLLPVHTLSHSLENEVDYLTAMRIVCTGCSGKANREFSVFFGSRSNWLQYGVSTQPSYLFLF